MDDHNDALMSDDDSDVRHAKDNPFTIINTNTRSLTPKIYIWSEWRLTVIADTVRIALVDILDLSEVDIPAGVFLHPTVGWG